MVQAISPSTTVATIMAVRSAQTDTAGVIMPVRPAQAIYASFRHIDVLPDSRLSDGVPLYKLRILDSLIDRLSGAGTADGTGGLVVSPAARKDAGAVDRMITELTGSLRAAGAEAEGGGGAAAAAQGLGGHAHRGVGGAVAVVAADALHDLEEEAVGERLGVELEIGAGGRAVVQQVVAAQVVDHGRRDVEAGGEIVVVVGGNRQGAHAVRGE